MPIYNKLVRDKIPQVIEASGKRYRAKILDDVQYKMELHNKLKEELNEYLVADSVAESLEELADMLEVIQSLAIVHDASPEGLEKLREKKAEQRGGFQERVYLIDVDDEA